MAGKPHPPALSCSCCFFFKVFFVFLLAQLRCFWLWILVVFFFSQIWLRDERFWSSLGLVCIFFLAKPSLVSLNRLNFG